MTIIMVIIMIIITTIMIWIKGTPALQLDLAARLQLLIL